jgi:hypothetical protein
MRILVLLMLLMLSVTIHAADPLTTRDGKTIPYDTIELEPKTPKTALLLRQGTSVTTLKLSEVDPAALPKEQREQLEAYTKQQKEAGLILLDDEWLNRDEHLLKLDQRFAYEKKLHRNGRNLIKVKNPDKRRVTLGLRCEGKGLEFRVEPGKTKSLSGIPDGDYSFYFVFETEGDASLEVEQSGTITLKNTEFDLSMAQSADGKGIATRPVGSIEVPKAMRNE